MSRPDYLYGIYNITDKVMIWNARGSAYKKVLDVMEKLRRLRKRHPDKCYEVVIYERRS